MSASHCLKSGLSEIYFYFLQHSKILTKKNNFTITLETISNKASSTMTGVLSSIWVIDTSCVHITIILKTAIRK